MFAAPDSATFPRHARRPLRVAVVSKADRCGGGASLVAEQLAALLGEAGHEVDHWMAWHGRPLAANARPLHGRWTHSWIRHLHNGTRHLGLPDVVPAEGLVFTRRLARYDVVHFHDISSAVSPLTVRFTARRRPTVWTFHDCSPFTGGCLYPRGCEAFTTRCGTCPQLDQWPLGGRLRLDFTGFLQDMKRRTAAEQRFTAVAPSHWMADEALRSGMFASRPQVIPNCVDPRVYRPYDKRAARTALGLAPDAFWVLISAGALADRRKGAEAAIDAVRRCQREVAVLLVGRDDPAVRQQLAGVRVHASGFLTEADRVALHYAAADVLLFPTLADNLPCTILEALAAGTPTLSYRVGGVPEMVQHAHNGWLAEAGDVDGLTDGLRRAFDDRALLRRWSAAGQRMAAAHHHPDAFVQQHLALYEETAARWRQGVPFATREAAPKSNDDRFAPPLRRAG